MKTKEDIKRGNMKTFFIITNLIIGIFAFSYIVSGQTTTQYRGKEIIQRGNFAYSIGDSDITYDSIGDAKRAIDALIKSPSTNEPIQGHLVVTGTSSTTSQVVTTKELTILSDSEETISTIPKGNLYTLNSDGAISTTINNKEVIISSNEVQKYIDEGSLEVIKKEGSSTLSQFFGASGGTGWDALLTGAQWAGIAYLGGEMIGGMLGLDDNEQSAVSAALAGGAFTIKSLTTLESGGFYDFLQGSKLGSAMLNHPIITGVVAGAIIFAVMYKKTETKTVTFDCMPWQAPGGGENCELCNDQAGCTEYRCKSLGQGCELLNAGTGEEKCAWVNPEDTKSPGISPWYEKITNGYEYTDVRERPAGDGGQPGRMRIQKIGGGCVEPYTPLTFGIRTIGPDGEDEPAQCKIDYNHTQNFTNMNYWFGESNIYKYNHTQTLVLPHPTDIQTAAPELKHDGTYNLYVRCRDKGGERNPEGNENVDEFVIQFCVDPTPDTTPPEIVGTSIANNMPVKFNQSQVDLEVYVNEPAECRWSRDDKSYDQMETDMTCSKNFWEMNNQNVYTCKTTLTGIKNRQENTYYFRCKDQPNAEEADRNTNIESTKFTLIGTQPLNIMEVHPNGTVKGSTEVISAYLEVETANGYKNGDAICYYSDTQEENDYIEFYQTGNSTHTQRLDLTEGNYKYYIKCVDLGGNRDDNYTEFTIDSDTNSPTITRVYRENDLLKIITQEESTCKYSTENCNFEFEDGIEMPYDKAKEHVAEWETENTHYIRCSDNYGNLPVSNTCSITVRPYDVIEQKEED